MRLDIRFPGVSSASASNAFEHLQHEADPKGLWRSNIATMVSEVLDLKPLCHLLTLACLECSNTARDSDTDRTSKAKYRTAIPVLLSHL